MWCQCGHKNAQTYFRLNFLPFLEVANRKSEIVFEIFLSYSESGHNIR